MKKISIILFLTLSALGTFCFQNCGGPKATFDENLSISSSKDYRDEYSIDALTGEDVELIIPETNFTDYYFSGECKWTYTNLSNITKSFTNPEPSYRLPAILKKQAGTYTLTCTKNTLTHKYIFIVNVTEPPQIDGVPAGPYKLFYVINGIETLNASEPLVTEADAQARCAAGTASAPEANGIKCLWGATVFYSRGENIPPPRATGRILFISGGRSSEVGSRANITRAEAVNLCKQTADDNRYKSYGMKCIWGTETIFSR